MPGSLFYQRFRLILMVTSLKTSLYIRASIAYLVGTIFPPWFFIFTKQIIIYLQRWIAAFPFQMIWNANLYQSNNWLNRICIILMPSRSLTLHSARKITSLIYFLCESHVTVKLKFNLLASLNYFFVSFSLDVLALTWI